MTNLLPAFTGAPAVNTVYQVDALTLLAALPDESVDLIATDPLYGIGYKPGQRSGFGGKTRRMAAGYTVKDDFDASWLPEAARVLKDGGAFYMCARWDVLERWKNAVNASGLRVKQRIIWDKGHWGQGDLDYYGSQTEDVLFAVKGKHELRWDKRFGNVWRIGGQGNIWNENRAKYNITQKPILLMARMIELSSRQGDLVLDPFMGSGTTLVAAKRLKRHFLGCDIDLEQVNFATLRLQQPYTQNMFAVQEQPA